MNAEDMSGFLICSPSSYRLKVRDSRKGTPKRGSIPPPTCSPHEAAPALHTCQLLTQLHKHVSQTDPLWCRSNTWQ